VKVYAIVKNPVFMNGSGPQFATAHHLSGRQVAAITAGIFVIAFCFRMAVLMMFPNVNYITPREMEKLGRSWAETGELANPYVIPTGPSAQSPPVYPILLGMVYRIWGTEDTGQTVQHALGWTFSALRSALLFPLALYLGLDVVTAGIAAFLGTFYIAAFATELRGAWDAPLTACLLIGVMYLFVRLERKGKLSAGEAVLYGLFVGFSLLEASALLPVAAGFVAVNGWHLRKQIRKYAVWCLVFGLTAFAVLAPWGIRNQRRLGKFILTRSEFGIAVWLGFHEGAVLSALESATDDPNASPEMAAEVRDMGEVAFNEKKLVEAKTWIRENPGRTAELALMHLVNFWLPPAEPFAIRVVRDILTLGAWAGWILMWRRKNPARWPILTVWVTFCPLYLIIYWSSRHRYPMESTLLMAFAYAVASCGEWLKRATPGEKAVSTAS
jgi:hypothetical protein